LSVKSEQRNVKWFDVE